MVRSQPPGTRDVNTLRDDPRSRSAKSRLDDLLLLRGQVAQVPLQTLALDHGNADWTGGMPIRRARPPWQRRPRAGRSPGLLTSIR